MERYVAVNIALRLSPDVEALCKQLNTAEGADPFSDFRKPDNYPHITLAMGVFPYKRIDAMTAAVRSEIKKDSPVELTVLGLDCKDSPEIGIEYQLQIFKTSPIVDLHTRIMQAILPYRDSVPACQEMFHLDSDETWEPKTVHWIDAFRHKTSHSYNPHISLKCRTFSPLEEGLQFPITFSATKIMIGYMGNYCTVRQLREEIPFSKS